MVGLQRLLGETSHRTVDDSKTLISHRLPKHRDASMFAWNGALVEGSNRGRPESRFHTKIPLRELQYFGVLTKAR